MTELKSFGRGAQSTVLLVLCALYFVLAMGLTVLSSGVYRRTAADSDLRFSQRTALSYLINQTRQGDISGSGRITVGDFSGTDALFLRSDGYITILYVWDGFLRELYMEDGLGLSPEDGVEILPLGQMSVDCREGLLTFTVSDLDGSSWSASVRPRCGVGQEGMP